MNPFNVGDRVCTVPSMATQRSGVIEHTACYGATSAGGKTCSYKRCTHLSTNDYCWMRDANGGLFSYIYGELMLDPAHSRAAVGTPTFHNATAAAPSLGSTGGTIKGQDADLAVPVNKTNKSTDAIVEGFKKGIQEIHISRSKQLDQPLQNNEIDWEEYNGFGPKGTKRTTYRRK